MKTTDTNEIVAHNLHYSIGCPLLPAADLIPQGNIFIKTLILIS